MRRPAPADGARSRHAARRMRSRSAGLRCVLLALGLGSLAGTCLAQGSAPAEELLRDLGCAGCHDGLPADTAIREKAPDLSQAGLRYRPDFLLGFLQYPVRIRQNMGASRMPSFFLDEREALALVLFLAEQVPAGRAPPDRGPQEATEKAKTRYPDVTAAVGRQVFYALNCVACHRQFRRLEIQARPRPERRGRPWSRPGRED